MIDLGTSDDASVYRINDEQAVILTLDFFTPVVDDPYTFGQIAAANSLSDIYAMGGRPVAALNITCFPPCLPLEMQGEILRGGADKVKEAGTLPIQRLLADYTHNRFIVTDVLAMGCGILLRPIG